MNFKSNVKYSVVKTSYNSSKKTWDEEKAWEIAYMMTAGLEHGTFFAETELVDTREEAQRLVSDVRYHDARELQNRRYGYASYKHKIWVHEFLKKDGHRGGDYLPTVGEIKIGLAYINENLKSENFRRDWVDWAVKHDGMTPSQIRKELAENYLKD